MTKYKWTFMLLSLCLLIGYSGSGIAKTKVVTSFSILADFVTQVGGDKVEVQSIIPLGGDPHHWEATSREAANIANADILFYNGMGLELWLDKLVESAAKDSLHKVVLSQGLTPLPGVTHDIHNHESGDPHFWLDVQYAIHYVKVITETLVGVDPANKEYYQKRTQAYLDKLIDLDDWLVEQVASIPQENRKIVSYHDSFNYLAHRYGLTVVGFVVNNPDREPSPRDLGNLTKALAGQKRKIIFTEPQVGSGQRYAEVLAKEVGGKVYTLYSDSLTPEVSTYLDMMYFNGKTLVEALQ